MVYYIYMTTNLINGMRYIGKHYGEINDSYLGNGAYGVEQASRNYFNKSRSKKITKH